MYIRLDIRDSESTTDCWIWGKNPKKQWFFHLLQQQQQLHILFKKNQDKLKENPLRYCEIYMLWLKNDFHNYLRWFPSKDFKHGPKCLNLGIIIPKWVQLYPVAHLSIRVFVSRFSSRKIIDSNQSFFDVYEKTTDRIVKIIT